MITRVKARRCEGSMQHVLSAVNGPGLGGWWADFLKYNSADSWGDAFASAYGWLNYGTVPALVEPSAGQTPQQIGDRQRAAILAAEQSGSWSPEPRLGVTATDFDNARKAAEKYKWLLLAGAVGLGYVALRVSMPRRG